MYFHKNDREQQQLLFSIQDTADVLGLGRTTTYALINEGRLKAIKLGRRTLVTASSIKALIAESEVSQ